MKIEELYKKISKLREEIKKIEEEIKIELKKEKINEIPLYKQLEANKKAAEKIKQDEAKAQISLIRNIAKGK